VLRQPTDWNYLPRFRFVGAALPVAEPFVDPEADLGHQRCEPFLGGKLDLRCGRIVSIDRDDPIVGLIVDDARRRIAVDIVPCFDGTEAGS